MLKSSKLARACLAASALVAITAAPAFAAHIQVSTVPAAVTQHKAAFVKALNPATPLKLQVVLPMRNKAELSQFAHAVADPDDPHYRHYLTVAQFTERFGPTKSDYDAAIRFFNDSGLKVTHTAANRYLFQIEGTAADVERVLHVNLNLYQHPTENRTFMAPDREPTLDLGVPVQHIADLDTFVLPYPKFVRGDGSQRAGGSGPSGNFIGSDFRAAYYGTGKKAKLTGKGQSVGLMEFEGYIASDIPLYFNTVKQPLNVPVNGISVDGTAVNCGNCDDGEQTLDVDYAISMAPGLDQVQVYVGSSALAIEDRMASDNTSKQLSTSWGYGEDFADEDPLYQEMAAQGQGYFTASGDYSQLQQAGPWPEEDANITAVGGTDLVTDGAGGPWKSEPGWVDSASGPSVDQKIKIESYQLPFINTKNKGSTTLRNVSDISANANFDMFICADGGCGGGVGGTSFSSPTWAGFSALANEQATKGGGATIGFVNPTLYNALMHDKKITHDIVGNQSGIYPAVKGYDLVGGLGSPNGVATINALAGK